MSTWASSPTASGAVVPDAVGVFTGWKALKVNSHGVLVSPRIGVRWPEREPLRASCYCRWPPGPHDADLVAPVEGHGCGLYVADLGEAAEYGSREAVLVRVAVWGKVIRGSHGARAEFAYPQEIYCFNRALDAWARLAGVRYGVPVTYSDKVPRTKRSTDSDVGRRRRARKRSWLWALLLAVNTWSLVMGVVGGDVWLSLLALLVVLVSLGMLWSCVLGRL